MTPLFTCIYSLPQTQDFALKVYHYLLNENIKIVYLKGDVGTGKTTFIKTLLAAIDPTITVTSPTYTYVNEYQLIDRCIWHFDLYRIESKNELEDLGLIDYLTREDGIAFVEWPEKLTEFQLNQYKKTILQFFHIENKEERACVIYS